MSRNGRHFAVVTVLVAISTVVTYFVLNAIYRLPEAASQQAGPIDRMFNAHFIVIAFLFSLIVVFMIYSIVTFRRKDDEDEGAHFHGHTGLEVVWTVIPLFAVLGFGVWGAFTLNEITQVGANELVVQVTGRQWSWVFSYAAYEDVGTSTTLVLPVDRDVLFELHSEDVLHSFWVPEFRVKQDLVPGKTTTLRVTPTEEGTYKLRCAEICGFDHAGMLAEVQVVSQDAFDRWIDEQSTSLADLSPAERGAKWATDYGCSGCHSIDGSPLAGPTWLGLFGREEALADGTTVVVDEEYLRESILHPGASLVAGFQDIMPSNFADRFATDQPDMSAESGMEIDIVADFIAYIRSLEQ